MFYAINCFRWRKKLEDIRSFLFAGADKVSINSSAIKNPDLIRQGANNFGTQCIVVAIDAKATKKSRIKSGYEVFSHGGRKPTNIDAIEIRQAVSLGAGELLATSMDRDGTKKGFDLDLTKKVSSNVSVR